jgi:predicted nucleotidyltransferase
MKTLQAVNLVQRERAAIEAAARHLKENYPIDDIILFGSKARGQSDAYSDIDLLVVAARVFHWREEKAIISDLFDIGLKYDVIFSPVFATSQEWRGGIFTEFPIYQEILRDGVTV